MKLGRHRPRLFSLFLLQLVGASCKASSLPAPQSLAECQVPWLRLYQLPGSWTEHAPDLGTAKLGLRLAVTGSLTSVVPDFRHDFRHLLVCCLVAKLRPYVYR